MRGTAVGEDQTIEAIDSASAQVWIQDAFLISGRPGVEQPVAASRAEMHGRAGAEIEHVDFQNGAGRPMRMFDIKMAGGQLRKKMHSAENRFRQRPVRVIEND